VCNPTPVARIEFLSVRCPTMLFCCFSSFLKRAHRDEDDFENNARTPRKDAAAVGLPTATVRRPAMEALRKPKRASVLHTKHATVSQAKTPLHASARARVPTLWRFVQRSRPFIQSSTRPSVASLTEVVPSSLRFSQPGAAGTPGCPASPRDLCPDASHHRPRAAAEP
jgi:hypothetical protein